MNLFFVHTPFQILTAQNIVKQYELSNNILVLSYTGPEASHYYKSFEVLLKKDIWNTIYQIGDLNNGIFNIKYHYKAVVDFIDFNKKISKIFKNHIITDIYFGDLNHLSYIYLSEKYYKGRKLHFFEEGISHYCTIVKNKRFERSIGLNIKKVIVDFFIYLPFGVFNFSKYLYPTKNCDFGFPIYKRYSLIKQNEESFDVNILFNLYKSEQLNKLLEDEKINIDYTEGNFNILYLSTSTSAEFTDPAQDELDMFKIITKNKSLDSLMVYIKYHPKDGNDKKQLIVNYCINNQIRYKEIFKEISLPIEILYSEYNFNMIVGYDSSSLFYAQVMSKSEVFSLLPNLIEMYKSKNISNRMMQDIFFDMDSTHMKLFGKNLPKLNN